MRHDLGSILLRQIIRDFRACIDQKLIFRGSVFYTETAAKTWR